MHANKLARMSIKSRMAVNQSHGRHQIAQLSAPNTKKYQW